MGAKSWDPDGALLCNCGATMFKLNFQQSCPFELFEYVFPHMRY